MTKVVTAGGNRVLRSVFLLRELPFHLFYFTSPASSTSTEIPTTLQALLANTLQFITVQFKTILKQYAFFAKKE